MSHQRHPRYSKEEFARRGNEMCESQIRSQVEENNHGKIVAIDIETGAYEVADNIVNATDRLFDRYPDAQPLVILIWHRAVFRFGSRSLRKPVRSLGWLTIAVRQLLRLPLVLPIHQK